MSWLRSSTIIYIVFITILITGFVGSIDLGIIAFNQKEARYYFKLEDLEQVKFLRVLTILGNAIGALLSLFLFSRVPPKYILSLSLPLESTLLALSVFLPQSNPAILVSLSLRGICQGLWLVYFPLWIDRNAPLKYQSLLLSLWFSINACGVSLGGALNITDEGILILLLVKFCVLLVPCSLIIWIVD